MPKGKSIPVTRQSEDDIQEAKRRVSKSRGTKEFLELPKTMARIRARGAADMQNAYGDQWTLPPRKRLRSSRRKSR